MRFIFSDNYLFFGDLLVYDTKSKSITFHWRGTDINSKMPNLKCWYKLTKLKKPGTIESMVRYYASKYR